MWGRIAEAAIARKDDPALGPVMQAKLIEGCFFMERVMPETGAHLARIASGAQTIMSMPVESF